MSLIRGIFILIFTIIITIFAVLNAGLVDIAYSPVHESVSLPLYTVSLSSTLVGFVFGGILVWLNMSKLRRDRRRQKREIKALEKEVKALKDGKFSAPKPPAEEIFPALPNSQS